MRGRGECQHKNGGRKVIQTVQILDNADGTGLRGCLLRRKMSHRARAQIQHPEQLNTIMEEGLRPVYIGARSD